MPLNENTVDISNLSPGECISNKFNVTVVYTNANNAKGDVSVSCGGAGVLPDQPAPNPSGTLTFFIEHPPGDSDGHTVVAELKHGGVKVAGDSVGPVGIRALCPIVIGGGTGVFGGLITLDPANPLSGTFDPQIGNRVVVHVQQPKTQNGALRQPLLTFANPAMVNVQAGQGTWKQDPVPEAAEGQHVRVILTKDGKVKSIARAIFKKQK